MSDIDPKPTEDRSVLLSADKKLVEEPNQTAADRALLDAAAGNGDTIVLTADILNELGVAITERKRQIREDFPKLVADCPEDVRLAVACWVVHNLVEHARWGGTFRYLIYQRLGFGPEAYVPMLDAGAMEISNEFRLPAPEPDPQNNP
jgi:hypothetical protein